MPFIIVTMVAGIVVCLRSSATPAAVSWAVVLDLRNLENSWLVCRGYRLTAYVFTIPMLIEFITDQLMNASRWKVPLQFTPSLSDDAFSGPAIGTFSGTAARGQLTAALRDRPASLKQTTEAIVVDALVLGAM